MCVYVCVVLIEILKHGKYSKKIKNCKNDDEKQKSIVYHLS